jgi:hypothetical protein
MGKVIIDIKPIMVKNEDNKYTIFDTLNKGGAIVSNMDPLIAMENFKEGTNLGLAVKTLMQYKEEKGLDNNFYIANFI